MAKFKRTKNVECDNCQVRADIAQMCGDAIGKDGLCGVCREYLNETQSPNVTNNPAAWSPEIAEAMKMLPI